MSKKSIIKRAIKYIFKGVPTKYITANISYLQPDARLKDKKIIITGGGRGLGLAMAKRFIEEGADVLIAGRSEKTLKEASDVLGGCKYLILDVSDTTSFSQFISDADSLLGGCNALVNNAGISLHEKNFFDVTPESFDAQVDTNLKGSFFLTQQFILKLKTENRTGTILFTSSETGETSDYRPYAFTKAAVNSMVKGLANMFAKDGIRINAIAPGITATDMTGLSKEGNLYFRLNTIERVYLPEEVAETALFLLSDASGCLAGQIVTCNNARTVNPRWK